MKSQRQAAKPQNPALAALTDFLQDVALGDRNATLEEVIEAKEALDSLLPDAENDQLL